MSRAFIVEGDALSHGGHVLAGSEHAGIDGQAFACEGHPATCPLHGRTHIEGASSHLNIHGCKAALNGDKLACGATLIAGRQRHAKHR
ncbi:PAAR domain-containing protein [Xanthomonas oryzae pv. oryzicola]|uniref:PAAR domain-containing protein n=1 Tax=Xanthomonas oryzae TaxID=347 RepID=UPI0009EA4CDF|nr:PAAR domain-containing protein [Xanthomonas oryzae]